MVLLILNLLPQTIHLREGHKIEELKWLLTADSEIIEKKMAEEENSIEQEEELPVEDPNPVVPDEEVEDAEASEELVEEDEEEREEEESPPPVDCPQIWRLCSWHFSF